MSGPGGANGGGDNANYGDDPDVGEGSAMDASRDITHVKAILDEAGIVDYDPRVVHLLLDLLYATTSGLLTKAKAISQHCGKIVIDETDVQMAVDFSGSVFCSLTLNGVTQIEIQQIYCRTTDLYQLGKCRLLDLMWMIVYNNFVLNMLQIY
uniref:Histone domain-containing protein n=1 Tax=Angiostrongylus cantonensis TaxID=6313 RepID=A0A0K0DF40_ANGCA